NNPATDDSSGKQLTAQPHRYNPSDAAGEELRSDTLNNDIKRAENIEAVIRGFIREKVSQTLKVSKDKIDDKRPLSDIGMDSILVVHLANNLGEVLGELSTVLLFEYPDVNALTRYVLTHHKSKFDSFKAETVSTKNEKFAIKNDDTVVDSVRNGSESVATV